MLSFTFTKFKKNLDSIFDQINKNNEPILVSSEKGKEVVVLSKSEFDSIEETLYLLRSPKNARRLLESIEQLNKGELKILTKSGKLI